MALRWRVDVEDQTGATVASFTDFISLRFTKKISDKGDYQLGLSGFDERVTLIEPDAIMRFWTQDPEFDLDWTEAFTGLHKTAVDSIFENGRRTWVSYGPSLEEALDKAYILYDATTVQADKNAAATTVMIEYVAENVGSLATVGNGRDATGTNPITAAADPGGGGTWSGKKSRKPLLDTLREISQFTHQNNSAVADKVDFRVNYTEDYTLEFQAGQIGVDRTNTGVVGGLNTAGNAPLIFSPYRGNVARMSISESRYNEANVVVSLGPGNETTRLTGSAANTISRTRSPLAQREAIINVNDNNVDTADLDAAAEGRVWTLVTSEEIHFKPYKARGSVAFKDYFCGDFVTAENFRTGEQTNKQIRSIAVNVTGGTTQVEDIEVETIDV